MAERRDISCPPGVWGDGSGLFSDLWRTRTERQYAELEVNAYANDQWNRCWPPSHQC